MHGFLRPYMDFTFVIKPALMKTPFLCNIMRALDAIVVSRDNPRQDLKTVLEEGKKRLDAGRSVVVFPQGTRSVEFDPEKFNTIGVKLAKSAGHPVIPLALKTDFLQNGKYLRDLGPIKRDEDVWFEFGPAMEVTGNGRETQQAIIDFISDRLNKWNA
jgi:1-acyl-sn-glycerol-3-phosphate acyltransferase